jgi:hypothetical protein
MRFTVILLSCKQRYTIGKYNFRISCVHVCIFAFFQNQVPKGEGKSVFFPIVPSALGNIELEVSAQSTMAADAVRRYLLVQVKR